MRRTVRRAKKTARRVKKTARRVKSKMSKKSMRRSSKKARKPTKKKKKKKKGKQSAWNKHVMVVYKSMKKTNSAVKLGDAMKAAKKTYKKGKSTSYLTVDGGGR